MSWPIEYWITATDLKIVKGDSTQLDKTFVGPAFRTRNAARIYIKDINRVIQQLQGQEKSPTKEKMSNPVPYYWVFLNGAIQRREGQPVVPIEFGLFARHTFRTKNMARLYIKAMEDLKRQLQEVVTDPNLVIVPHDP